MEGATRGKWFKMLAAAIAAVVIALAALFFLVLGQQDGRIVPPEAVATFGTGQGDVSFDCEVADTFEERAEGLMDRESLNQDAGMLFVFDSPLQVEFWMKNTLIPLDIIFIAENGTVLNVAEAVPEPGVADADLTRYPSAGPVLYVVEVNGGMCGELGIVPGTVVSIEYTDI